MIRLSSFLPRAVQCAVPKFFRKNISTSAALRKKRDDDDYEEIKGPPINHGPKRAFDALAREAKEMFVHGAPPLLEFSTFCDICIIGGGVMGSSIAYHIKEGTPRESLRTVVIEKDPTYMRSSTVLSVGGVRQQFSLEENIQMSMYGAEFLRNAKRLLEIEDSKGPDMHFHPQGYLFLASENGAEQMVKNHELQKSLGAKVQLMSPEKLKEKFPWLNTDGVALGSQGLENEGWFDPWSLLYGFKRKAMASGVEYINAEVVGFDFVEKDHMVVAGVDHDGKYEGVERVVIRLPDGRLSAIKFSQCVIAAGHNSGKIAEMARIGRGDGLLSVPLPVEPRKRYVYFYHAPDPTGPSLDCPLVIDPTGAYFRREGLANHFLAGQSPANDDEPSPENLDVDYSFFDEQVWPIIANRVPAFNNIKVKSAWAGYYDYNYFDQNGIIGPHPYYPNLWFATGFSGHGIQQAPAVGRAIGELILDGNFETINLTRFGFDRFIVGKEIKEQNIV